MRFAIASDDGVRIAAHTGRCQGFAVYEMIDGQVASLGFRENNFTAHAHGECTGDHDHDHGHDGAHAHHSHGPLLAAIADCCALVTRGLGPRLVADLAAQGIDAYVCGEEQVAAAAKQYAQGTLQRAAGTGCCRHAPQ